MANQISLLKRRETMHMLQIKTINKSEAMLEAVTVLELAFVLNLLDLVIKTDRWLKRRSFTEVSKISEMEVTILKLIRRFQMTWSSKLNTRRELSLSLSKLTTKMSTLFFVNSTATFTFSASSLKSWTTAWCFWIPTLVTNLNNHQTTNSKTMEKKKKI